MTTTAKTPKSLRPCTCSLYESGAYGPDGSAESYESYGTGCTQQTRTKFAMGHDAKLVGFLVRAELDGREVSKTEGGVRVTFHGAVAAASSISHALGIKAKRMIVSAVVRAQAKKDREAAKAAKKENKAAASALQPVTIKAGRWTYEATIDPTTSDAHVVTPGKEKTIPAGKYKLA